MTDQELMDMAKKAAEYAYVPYSKFPVGAALECSDGTIFTGCNVENAAYGDTICAERTAAATATLSASPSGATAKNIVIPAARAASFCRSFPSI